MIIFYVRDILILGGFLWTWKMSHSLDVFYLLVNLLIDEIYLTPVIIWRPLQFLFAVPKTVYLDPSTFMASDKIGHHASQTTSRQTRLKAVHSGSPTHDALWNYKPPEGRRPIKVAYLCAGVHLGKYFTAHLRDNDPLGQTRVGSGVF